MFSIVRSGRQVLDSMCWMTRPGLVGGGWMRNRMLLGLVAFVLLAAGCEYDRAEQLGKMQVLMQNQAFAVEMAAYLDGAYYRGQGQTPPPFLSSQEETATIQKSVKEEKIAINLAGFYAVES